MKRIALLAMISFFALFTYSQITITVDDLLDVGDSINLAGLEEVPQGFSPGPSGPNQHWDFSDLGQDTVYTLRFIDPATTPYGSSFPGSNIAAEGIIESFAAEGYAYATRNMGFFKIDGFAGSYDIFEDLVVPFEPPEVMFDFPVNYLDSLEQTSVMDITIESPEPAADSVRIKVVTSVESKVDSWGELTTPVWTGQVLRMRDLRTTIDSSWVKVFFFWVFLESNTSVNLTYKYVANNAGYPVMQFNADTTETEFSMMNYSVDVGVGQDELSAKENNDLLVYPNPASGLIHVRTPGLETNGELLVYDLMGRQLKTLPVLSKRQDYTMNVSELPSGIYQLVLRSENLVISTGKVVIR